MSGWLRRALCFLADLVYVPRCAVCDARLPFRAPLPLCPICRAQYENEKDAACPVCAGRMSDCFCLPPHLPPCGVRRAVKLVRYRPAEQDASARVIYKLKHRDLRPIQEFCAAELALPLSRLMDEIKEGEAWCVTAPPRSGAAKLRDGFDHGEALGRALAEKLACPYVPALRRSGGPAGEQKTRSRTARLAAAKENYAVRPGLSLAGRRVILVDDVLTTGATLSACARLLRRAGAREVVLAYLAQTASRDGRT